VPLQNLDQKRTKTAPLVRFLKKLGIKLSNSGAMAGEYSRELSAKVFAGQCRVIEPVG
jgi:hypothetical protein